MVDSSRSRIGFVLGGGGNLGACEVGMLRALIERETFPDLVIGSSVGALNGAAIAVEPSLASIERLEAVWLDLEEASIFQEAVLARAVKLVRRRTSLRSNDALRRLVEETLAVRTFEELAVPFQCVAAHVEQAAEHWFSAGDLVDAILASAAVPGLFPAVEIGGEHYLDGGLVNSIPIWRAIELGATELYVLQVGRIEHPLKPPTNPWQVAIVSFEIARRHRFARDLAALPHDVVAHVLPTGIAEPLETFASLRTRRAGTETAIRRAYEATARYLGTNHGTS